MNAVTFDTLAYVKRLREAGIDGQQAEAQAEALAAAIQGTVASKADLEAAIAKAVAELRVEIRDAQTTLIKWLVPLMIGQSAITAALVKLL